MEGGIFFLSSSSSILKIHVIDVQFTSQDCKTGDEGPGGEGTYIQDDASSVVSR